MAYGSNDRNEADGGAEELSALLNMLLYVKDGLLLARSGAAPFIEVGIGLLRSELELREEGVPPSAIEIRFVK